MDADQIIQRATALKNSQQELLWDRMRIRNVMNGGVDGIYAAMVWDQGKGASMRGRKIAESVGIDLPAVNLVASGLERHAQQIGVVPTLKLPYGPRESVRSRRIAEKRERIVDGWDRLNRLHMHFPQIGRWLPGYTNFIWTLKTQYVHGDPFPWAKLRDPFDVYVGWFGPDQEPHEMAVVRIVPIEVLEEKYPDHDWKLLRSKAQENRVTAGGPNRLGADYHWEGKASGIEVFEYYDTQGTYLACPELETVFDFIPNPIEGTTFVVGKKFSFDRPVSQYHHVWGLMGMLAKLNILGMIASEDATFREVNIIGEMIGDTYERGRFSTNYFEPGTRVEKAQVDQAAQLWAQIDRIERQIRVGSNYDVQQDGQSPNSFATGMGMRELQTAAANNVREYQTVIADATERLDTKRMQWDQALYPTKARKVFVMDGGKSMVEEYVPHRDIDSNYRTKRVYGMMATWDEATKLVGGLQLLQAGIIDPLTMQENLHGVDDAPKLNDRIAYHRAYSAQMAALEQMAAQGDPKAQMALVEIADKPADRMDILKKFFTPEEPQMSEEEMAMAEMMGGGMGGSGGLALGPEATVQTVLSQLEQSGAAKGGVQTVRSTRR